MGKWILIQCQNAVTCPSWNGALSYVGFKEVVFELLKKESQNKQTHSFLGKLFIGPCFERIQEAVDICILQIKDKSMINRLPDLSQGKTAGRAGEGRCGEEGLRSSMGLSVVRARTAFTHLSRIISEPRILRSFMSCLLMLKDSPTCRFWD